MVAINAEIVVVETRQEGPYIEFKEVSKAFGENRVLDHVSFDVQAGETVCILGRSGVGKSVTLQHIMGFLKPDAGRVIVAREDITDYDEPDLQRIRKKVTMVFQNGALFDSLTVRENVAFPLRERGDLQEDQIFQIVDGLLGDGRRQGNARPASLGFIYRDEALGRHRTSPRRPTGMRSLR